MAETSSEQVTSNSGASVPDTVAVGDDNEMLTDWFERRQIKTQDRIRLTKISHMRYQHPDLAQITRFLQDFGMYVVKQTDTKVWYRGYGSDQYVYYAQQGPKKFLGGTWEVESYEELEKAKRILGASSIEDLADSPGGGSMITITDPEGFPINLMAGQKPAEAGEKPSKLVFNDETDKPRARHFQRFEPGPAAVHKLGHYGFCVQEFEKMLEFYTTNFNIAPTDFLFVGQGKERKTVAVFAHVDRGAELVDHHSLFFSANPTTHVHHCSFEVHDYDTQNLGHQWLGKKGYESVWGVGRHVLGSQLFDYWWDTTGNMIEHYADGDLVNHQTPIGYVQAGDESLAVWGPEVPSTFLT